MLSWKERLGRKRILIADGGWGTEFIKYGLKPGEVPEAWNINRASDVRAVADSYAKAGADIILTNTFGANRVKLTKVGLEDAAVEINRLGVKISMEAAGQTAGERCLVFGSMGPTGDFLRPLGQLTEAEVVQCFAEQARVLAREGVDGIVLETMMDLGEAVAALRGVCKGTSVPVAVSMTFDRKKSGYATIMGVRPDQAVRELERTGADIVGANCGAGINEMIEVVQLMRQATSLPIWSKPNAGLPELIDGKTVYRETPERMASQLGRMVEAGVSFVGGCCGTTPAHIMALVAARNELAP